MPWVRMDEKHRDHPKTLAAGPLAALLDIFAWQYCSDNLTDGFVPEAKVRTLVDWTGIRLNGRQVDPMALAQRLCEAGRWEIMPHGFHVHDYLDYNPTAEKVKAERAANAARQAAFRNKAHASNGIINEPVTPLLTGTSQACHNLPVSVPVLSTTKPIDPQEDETPVVIGNSVPAARSERPSKPLKVDPAAYSEDFEAFWRAYPRTERGKAAAWKCWRTLEKSTTPPDQLIAAAQNYATYCQEQDTEPRFTALAATFLGPSRQWVDFRDGVPRLAGTPNGRVAATMRELHQEALV